MQLIEMNKVIVVTTLATFACGVKLPNNFQKCNREQPDLKECVLKAAQDGISQLTKPFEKLNIPSLKPFVFPEVYVEGGTGPVAVSQKFENCKVFGFPDFKMDTFEFVFDEKTLNVVGGFPEIRIECQYEMHGQILVIPVNGKGDSTITLKNLKTSAVLKYEEVKRKGKTYLKFISNDLTMDPELVTFNFVNTDDQNLSDRLNTVLNDNWKEIFDDVKGSYTEVVNKIALSLLNNFFAKVSLEEAFDD